MKILFLLLLVLFNSSLLRIMDSYTGYDSLVPYCWETDSFRALKLGKRMAAQEFVDCEELAAHMIEHGFDLTKEDGRFSSLRLPVKKPQEFFRLCEVYHSIFDDLEVFPVPESTVFSMADISYENGWMEPRTYGGERGHEGCDLMGGINTPGLYPVVSITDGVVEQTGWLPKGGFRIGIRAPKGAYFYYAHFSGYAKDWEEGTPVKAGELLGFMGDSGYGPYGTTGQFPVHLHLGIYLKTEHYEELSVNPYWILKYLEQYRTRAAY
ncbi:M23 family metallopeptidase [Lachnospiraceae bacterium 45-P1]